ncbi:magnesium transporter [Helicovermis profundi]|uniref:Magnesium transporter MgtE n=1 Tax=Helicovermis profundi TaxID=3065157 RepID=A0AAU9E4S8_9FIRM|nr:magnesium transporter [Clostridia bacterium S502]
MNAIIDENIDDIIDFIKEHFENNRIDEIKNIIEKMHPVDLADVLMELSDENRLNFLNLLSWEDSSEVLSELGPESFSEVLELLGKDKKTYVLDRMSQDDIVDKLGELEEDRRKEIIAYLDIENARDVRELLVYDEDTAGGIMTKDFISLKSDYTIYKAIETLRKTEVDNETIYYVYVTDLEERLVGVISLRELIIAKPNQLISEIMNENVISVTTSDDQEEVARIVSKYDLLVIPVTDNDGVLSGIITMDDIIDVIEEEATEDILKFAGSSDLEDFDEENFGMRILMSVRSRLPWLIITLFGGLFTSHIVSNFQGVINSNTTLAMFMPLLAGMGGNVGTQSSTLTVRSIAVDQIRGKEVLLTIFQEGIVGISIGIVCSIIVAISSFYLKGDILMSLIVGVAMMSNIVTAATIGTMVPIVFKKIGVDPAVASAPFISTTVDITGLTIYFTLATLMMKAWL